jgi:hypothetical protein
MPCCAATASPRHALYMSSQAELLYNTLPIQELLCVSVRKLAAGMKLPLHTVAAISQKFCTRATSHSMASRELLVYCLTFEALLASAAACACHSV